MRDILTDLYNKVINFFQAEKIEGENTKETAKSRLRLVLMQDRSNLEPETMAQLREELIEVISKYIVIDKESLGLNLDGDGESMALMLNIPVVRAKKPEEIREALEEAKAKQIAQVQAQQAENEEESEVEECAEENVDDESEEGVVEFSEGSIDEICECDGECGCGCQEAEECDCECHDSTQNDSCLTFNVQQPKDSEVEPEKAQEENETENNSKKNKKN